jgi:hypothetical protein
MKQMGKFYLAKFQGFLGLAELQKTKETLIFMPAG